MQHVRLHTGLCGKGLGTPLRKIFWIAQRIIRFPFRLVVNENARKNLILRIRIFLFGFMMSFKGYDVEEYWTQRGKFYYEVQESKREEKLDLSERLILGAVSAQVFDSILDFGCGYGKHLKVLSSQFRDKKMVGVDVSSSMLRKAQNYLRGTGVELRKINGLTLPFEDKSFDITLTAHVLIHNPPNQVNKIIKEIKRVTRKCSIHMESTVKGVVAKDYYCHDYERLFSINGGKVTLLSEYGKEGKLYKVDWH